MAAPEEGQLQYGVLALGFALAAALELAILHHSPRLAGAFAIGVLLGVTLYRASFGFSAAYRRLFTGRDVSAVRAQVVMLALATVLFAPVLSAGSFSGSQLLGVVAPAGWQVAAGAFFFGIGMQLANGCASGALYTAGGGSVRMLATLVAFCGGAFVASLHMGFGARIAYGCNIGAFFSGVASTSLHGWLWIAAALPGNWVGIRLRARFGLGT